MQEKHQNMLRTIADFLERAEFSSPADANKAAMFAQDLLGFVDHEVKMVQPASMTFLDESDASYAGAAMLATIPRQDGGNIYVSEDDGKGAIPKVKAVVRFDAHDRLRGAYLLSRDLFNRTQLSMLVPATGLAGLASLADVPARMPVSREDATGLNEFFVRLTHYDFCADNPADFNAATHAWGIVNRLLQQTLADTSASAPDAVGQEPGA